MTRKDFPKNMRSTDELNGLLYALLEYYEDLRKNGIARKIATEKVITQYDDLQDYLYFKGEYQ
jgi:hypothetical protein